MNYRGKKILILGGAGPHVKVVEAAKELGIYTIVADYLEPKDSPAKQIADEYLMNNIYDVEELSEYCIKNHVDGVVGFCLDPTQKPAQQIAEKVGLPMFGSKEQVDALTDKTIFKDLCKKCNVDIITEYFEEDLTNVEYPVLVKPAESRGSRGGSVCYNLSELTEGIIYAKEFSCNGKVIIEKYMTPDVNQDLTISYLVKDGNPVLVSLGDRNSGREEDNLNRQLVCTIQPSRFVKEYLEKVDERVKNMIKTLDIQNGPVFFQGFWDGDTVRMYDPGIRYPGNEYERLLYKATGINLMKSIIKYCVGGEIDFYNGNVEGCYDLNGKVCLQYIINVGPGTIALFEGLTEISKHPNIIDVQQRHFVGDVIENTGDIRHRAGEISILTERNSIKIKEIIGFIQNTLVIKDINGNNQIISPFDSTIIEKYGY